MVEIPDVEGWGYLDGYNKMYMCSSHGRFFNLFTDRLVLTSPNTHGQLRVNLIHPKTGKRQTKSVRKLVAQTWVNPPNHFCDEVAVLDGDFFNMRSDNLAWRPRWFVWKYAHQLKTEQPSQYYNIKILNTKTQMLFPSIVEAGMNDGILFDDLWLAVHSGKEVFPYGHTYEFG